MKQLELLELKRKKLELELAQTNKQLNWVNQSADKPVVPQIIPSPGVTLPIITSTVSFKLFLERNFQLSD